MHNMPAIKSYMLDLYWLMKDKIKATCFNLQIVVNDEFLKGSYRLFLYWKKIIFSELL